VPLLSNTCTTPTCDCDDGCTPPYWQGFTTVKNERAFTVPACEESVVITIRGLKSLEVGAYLWAADYGYFEITAFNNYTGAVTLVNHCTTGNVAPDTVVPLCTDFIIVAPPSEVTPPVGICSEVPTVDEATALGCVGEDAVPIAGAAEGYVLTLKDPNLQTAAYRPLGVEDCTTLMDDLDLLTGVTSYSNVTVIDSSVFQVNDVIRFANLDIRGSVEAITDGTHIDILVGPPPGADSTIPAGAVVCPIDCCEEDSIFGLIGQQVAFFEGWPGNGGTQFSPDTLTGATLISEATTVYFDIYNPHPTKAMVVTLYWNMQGGCRIGNALTDPFPIDLQATFDIVNSADGNYSDIMYGFRSYCTSSSDNPDLQVFLDYFNLRVFATLLSTYSGTDPRVPPLGTMQVRMRPQIFKFRTAGASSLTHLSDNTPGRGWAVTNRFEDV